MSDEAPPPLEVTAQSKFSCPLCGGEAQWNAAKQALVCIYCGAETPAKVNATNGAIEEHDLATALRDIPDSDRGWMTETRSVRCQSCEAITVFKPDRVAQRCDFCGSAALVPYEAARAPIRPESLLAFKISEAQTRDAAHQWYKTRWFAPDALKKAALTDEVHGFYLPYWTFDAQAHCPWSADAGYYYYVTENYRDSDGKSQSREVQKTRWEPASGQVEHFFNDELVAASKGVASDLIRQIEPFPTVESLVPYDPSYLSGWVVEQYQIDLAAAADRAEKAMDVQLRSLCGEEVPGDTYRNLQISPQYGARTFKHVLLPVWILSYHYAGQPYQMLVNGFTGQVAGRYPKSWIKIISVVIFILTIIAIIFAVAQGHHQAPR